MKADAPLTEKYVFDCVRNDFASALFGA